MPRLTCDSIVMLQSREIIYMCNIYIYMFYHLTYKRYTMFICLKAKVIKITSIISQWKMSFGQQQQMQQQMQQQHKTENIKHIYSPVSVRVFKMLNYLYICICNLMPFHLYLKKSPLKVQHN